METTNNLLDIDFSILKLIYSNNGKWYWYQLDRAISKSNGLEGIDLMQKLKRLTKLGFITVEETSGKPMLFITSKGIEVVRN